MCISTMGFMVRAITTVLFSQSSLPLDVDSKPTCFTILVSTPYPLKGMLVT